MSVKQQLPSSTRKPTVGIGPEAASEFRVDVPLVVGGENITTLIQSLKERIRVLEEQVAILSTRTQHM
jgi:hypothetical protein